MKILVVNPNTSKSMTDHLRLELQACKAASTTVTVVNPASGPPSIESAFDEALAIPPILAIIEQGERDGYDAAVIACFSDPGLDAAREIVSIPVVGIEESALHVAAMLGHRFTVLTARCHRVPAKLDHVARVGLSDRLASVRPLEMGVLEMDADPVQAKARILEVGRAAVEQDAAEVLVLGCAGLAGYGYELAHTLAVTIIDPATVALKMAELLVELKLTHSKRGIYARPSSARSVSPEGLAREKGASEAPGGLRRDSGVPIGER
jgi:allantoin racemase